MSAIRPQAGQYRLAETGVVWRCVGEYRGTTLLRHDGRTWALPTRQAERMPLVDRHGEPATCTGAHGGNAREWHVAGDWPAESEGA